MGELINAKNFMFGLGTDLLVHIGGVETKLRSALIGIKPDEYLLIESPRVSGIEETLYEGNKVTVIFMCGGTVYGFESTILNTVSNPSRLMFISFPENIQTHELREVQRVNCYIPAVISMDTDERTYQGIILDISRQGCSFNTVSVPTKSSHQFKLGISVRLDFQLPGNKKISTFHGKIQNLSMDEKIIGIGVQFDELDEEQRTLENYIDNASDLALS